MSHHRNAEKVSWHYNRWSTWAKQQARKRLWWCHWNAAKPWYAQTLNDMWSGAVTNARRVRNRYEKGINRTEWASWLRPVGAENILWPSSTSPRKVQRAGQPIFFHRSRVGQFRWSVLLILSLIAFGDWSMSGVSSTRNSRKRSCWRRRHQSMMRSSTINYISPWRNTLRNQRQGTSGNVEKRVFVHLYVAVQNRPGVMQEFLFHEATTYPPSLSDQGQLLFCKKSYVDLSGQSATTFEDYVTEVFIPHLIQQLLTANVLISCSMSTSPTVWNSVPETSVDQVAD